MKSLLSSSKAEAEILEDKIGAFLGTCIPFTINNPMLLGHDSDKKSEGKIGNLRAG